jgi:DNA-binding response OmpR family regulator
LKRALIIEDDKAIRLGMVDAFEFSGYEVFHTGNGEDGSEMAMKFNYDILLLDLNLPRKDGLEILRELKASRPLIPVIIITARGSENERVSGLKLGADDYVVKPFSIKELLARVEAVLRRSPERPLDIETVKLHDGVADLARCEVRYDSGNRQELSEREMNLLRYLVQNKGRAISREELLSRVWRVNSTAETRTIDMHVARLRDKLREDESKPDLIITVRGKGYMFAEYNPE